MNRTRAFLILALFLTSCGCFECIVGFKTVVDEIIAPELIEMSQLVVITDDPVAPSKTLYFNQTSQEDARKALRAPDLIVSASSGYSYWDYCYTSSYKVSLYAKPQNGNCNALRLFFDPSKHLYDHSHVVLPKK